MSDEQQAVLKSIAPFFIVGDIRKTVDFYVQKLGFTLGLLIPEDEPFFAIVRRDQASLMLKEIGPDTPPAPNESLHEWARWDAFVSTRNPDALYAEFHAGGVEFYRPLEDTDDGLRAFEVRDVDGHVLCFGWPLDDVPA